MITLEMIDELRKRVNVSFEDAKDALEQTNGDLLEAIIYLEKNNSIKNKGYNFKDLNNIFKDEFKKEYNDYKKYDKTQKAGETFTGFIKWSKKIISLGNRNNMVITKNDQTIANIPLTFVAIATVFGFYIVVPLLLVAMFTGHKINFKGVDIEKTPVNEYSSKFEDTVNDIKVELRK